MKKSPPNNANALERMLQTLGTAIVVLNSDQTVNYMNSSAEDLFGISLQRATGIQLSTTFPSMEDLTALCIRARNEQQSFGQTINIPALQRETGMRELAARVTPLGDDNTDQLLVELVDITQRHQLDREHALVAQHGVSRRMLQQLAHEIRNPLGGLRGAAQLLERELASPELKEFTRVIIGEADRLAGLVDGLLGPRYRPKLESMNVHEILERVATIVCSENSDLDLHRDYDPSLPLLWLDRDQMTQALLNLLKNAAQATDGVGTITLRTRVRLNQTPASGRYKMLTVISVEDNGPGVPSDIADTIFYPLVTGRDDGTGIGLPLAQDLVNRHHGLIEFTSEPGRTVFEVHLPVLDEHEAASGPPA